MWGSDYVKIFRNVFGLCSLEGVLLNIKNTDDKLRYTTNKNTVCRSRHYSKYT
jgi:hypothetical protein